MKKLVLFTLLIFISLTYSFAADEKFTKAMESVLATMRSSQTLEEMQQVANQLEQMVSTGSIQWLPAYWASYCYIHMSFIEKDNMQKDQYLDQADKFLQKAESLDSRNDEILVLKAYIALSRIAIDGPGRFMTHNAIFADALNSARKINPNNPRIYLLEGQLLYYTPETLGGGKPAACPKLKVAMEKYTSFKPASTISPDWGVENAKHLTSGCGN